MKLQDFIKAVLDNAPEGDIEFSVHLNSDATVSTEPTGNRITFTVSKKQSFNNQQLRR